MKYHLTIIIIYFGLFTQAQTVCNQTTVYFDFGKYELKQAEKGRIDSVLNISSDELLIEIYGHTDSVDGIDYNMQLSLNRVNEVISYLKSNNTKKLSFKKYYFGESQPSVPNSTDENRAQNRRVEINFIPLDNGQVVFSGGKGEQAKIDTSYFKDCIICNLKPKFLSYSTEEEANAAGIELITNDGEKLITGGMMSFKFEDNECVKEKEDCCIPITLSMPSNTMDTSMTAWTLDENGRWFEDINDSIILDSYYRCEIITSLCLFCSYEVIGRGVKNCDVRTCNENLNRLPYEIPTYIDSIEINKHFEYYKYSTNNNPFSDKVLVEKDSLIYLLDNWRIDFEPLRVVTYLNEDVYYLSLDSAEIYQLPYKINGDLCKFRISTIDSTLFKPILFNDTIVKLKIKGIKNPTKVGFYNLEFDHYAKTQHIKNRKFQSNYLDFPHRITFSEGRDKMFHFDYNEVKTKYKKKKQKLKVKIKKKHIRFYEETYFNKK